MKLSVIIVNYNVKYFLELCLNSLYRAIDQLSVEVFVVDNASTDGSLDYLKPRFSQVHFIANEENIGFARANNQAIALSKGEYILLLNPDTVVGEKVIVDCLDFMDTHSVAGGVGVKMVTGDGTFLPESKRGFPAPMTSFYKFTGLSRLFPNSTRFGKYHLRYLDENESHCIDVLAGAYMLMRKSTLDKCGLLDESFFMYGEDIDLSYRITQAGFENYYLPFPIIHYKGESTKKDSFKYVKVFYEAMVIFFKKHYPHYSVLFSCTVKTGIYLRALVALLNRMLKKIVGLSNSKENKSDQCFLVLGNEQMLQEVRELCRKNELNGDHHFLAVDEQTHPNGHLDLLLQASDFSHIVYDSDAFSYETIIRLISFAPVKGVEIGIYSVQTGILVTPQNSYL
ncbi:glycosyltransferase family 2 protein [Bacteroides sedimenti]|uniref:Glycosyltransferase 2-like domain-containing protein n=1 Tax=Bacteroides sedimenti TaxID=2136147 RepID=A0ABM8I9U7_9BACE